MSKKDLDFDAAPTRDGYTVRIHGKKGTTIYNINKQAGVVCVSAPRGNTRVESDDLLIVAFCLTRIRIPKSFTRRLRAA